jgi:hypothetical protein
VTKARLLGYPLAAALGFLGTWLVVAPLHWGKMSGGHPAWTREGNLLRNAARSEDPIPEVWRTVPRGDYPLDELDERAPRLLILPEGIGNRAPRDSWGHSYRVVVEGEPDVTFVGVYSTGRDGRSDSRGNDPDDINSWGLDWREYYPAADKRQDRLESLRIAGLWSLLTVPLAVLLFERRLLAGEERP